MGFPDSLYRELFGQSPRLALAKHKAHPLDYSTAAYTEMETALKLGLTLEQYRQLPRKERKMWYYYRILESRKEERSYERAREEAEMNKSPS